MLLNPWALFFLTAAGIPLAVHFLTRPRPVVLPISTLRFVREVIQQRRARHWLRDILTLIARTLAVILVVLAIARPKSGQEPLVSRDETADAVRVVLVDVSQSLSAVDGGTELFEHARAAAAEQLQYRPNLRANLILAGASPRAVFDQPSQNFDALRDELARTAHRPESVDVLRALSMAAEMLAPRDEADQRKRELVIVSDFQRANWAQADFSVLARDTSIQLESVAPKLPLANLGISAVRFVGQTTEQDGGRVEVDVGNWSPVTQTVTVEVQAGDSTRRLTGNCPAGRQTTLSDEFTLSELGWHTGVARLAFGGDALAADDEIALAVEVHPRLTYLLITRQPETLRPSSSHFLECALAPDDSAGTPHVVRTSPDKVDTEMLATADLIVIDHPGSLNPEMVQLLAAAMRRGKPLLYLAAEATDATTMQRLSSDLGRGIRLPVTFQPFPKGQHRRDQSLMSFKYDSRPFNALGENAAELVRDWRFGGGLISHPVPETLLDDVLATYADGSACLIFSLSDTSALAVLNADLGISNLPSRAAFVPLIDELTQLLTERRSIVTIPNCGQSLMVRLPVAGVTSQSLEIVGPPSADGDAELGELHDESGSVIWRWPAIGKPGVYRVCQNKATVFAIAVSAPAEESQLDTLSADVLQNRLVTGNAVFYRDAADTSQPHDPWWTWLTVGCLACLFGELATLLVFRT